jgi:hypothetical protein
MAVFLSETRTTTDIYDHELQIKGYNLIRCDSHTRHTGGVAIYLKSNVQFTITETFITNEIWINAIRIQGGIIAGLFAVVYRSPSCSKVTFLEEFEQWCGRNLENNEYKMIVGDFNIDLLKTDLYSKRLEILRKLYGLKHFIKEPTRTTQNSATLIDFVMSDFLRTKATIDPDEMISDHATIKITMENNKSENIKTCATLSKFKYSKTDFLSKLDNVDTTEINNKSLDEQANFYVNNLKNATTNMLWKWTVKRKNINCWYKKDFLKEKKIVVNCYKKATFTQENGDWTVFKNKRNDYVQSLRIANNEYDKRKLAECNGDQSKMWAVLKQIVKGNQINSIDYIKSGNTKITDKKEIAQTFNNYFVESIRKLNDEIEIVNVSAAAGEPSVTSIDHPNNEENFKFKPIDLETLNSVIKEIKLKSDDEHLNITVIKDSMPILGHVLLNIINKSLQDGQFPEEWKQSVVVPVAKKSGTKKVEEFRPINTLPTYEKILEAVVKKQLIEYLERKHILVDAQSGFRKSHSCETALNFVIAEWKDAMDKNEVTVALFLDLRRAFETIDQNILLQKLEKIGIIGKERQWFATYLIGRTQKTKVDGVYSDTIENKLGVAQGSTLGPILFLLYINDIVSNMNECKIKLFADDTLIYISEKDVNCAIEKMNDELKNLVFWLKINKLSLNLEKTAYMLISNRNIESENTIEMDNVEINKVDFTKYLGVILDSKLNFNEHFDFVLKKMAKKISFFWRISKKLDQQHRIMVYMTVIAPHIEYCSTILYILNEEKINKLQVLQNRAMRVILGCDRRTRIATMLEALPWIMTVKQRLNYNALVFIFRTKMGLLPDYLTNRIQYAGQGHGYSLRNPNRFRLPKYSKRMSQNSLFYKGLKTYDEMDNEIKNETNLNAFKRKCKIYVVEKF